MKKSEYSIVFMRLSNKIQLQHNTLITAIIILLCSKSNDLYQQIRVQCQINKLISLRHSLGKKGELNISDMCQNMALTHDWCIVKTLNSKLKLPWTPLWLNLPKIQLCIIVTFYQKFDLVSLRPFTKFWPCVIMTFYQKSDLVSLWPLGTIVLSMDWHALQPWLWYNNSFNSNIWKGTRYNMTEFVIDKYNISNDKITHWKMHFVRI